MTDAADQTYDLAVIGAGLAGMAAAVFAANRGIKTVVAGSLGESWFTGGLVDLMGVHPVKTGQVWDDPWAAIKAAVNDLPNHPYSHLHTRDIKAAMQEFFSFLNDSDLPYGYEENKNSRLITAFGSVKTTHGMPMTMWPGAQALSRKAPCLIAGLKGLKGFSPELLGERLKTGWPDLKTVTIPSIYNDQVPEINPIPFARDMEIEDYRQKLAELILPHAKGVEFVGLPALLGIEQSHNIAAGIGRLLGKPVFEIPLMPPSIPGLRLKDAFLRFLEARNVHCLFQKKVLKATTGIGKTFSLEVGRTGIETQIKAHNVLLATGRFSGGGLRADYHDIREPIFNLPVYQPGARTHWHNNDFFKPEGHAVNRAGLETDTLFRPLGRNGSPMYKNLFSAGIILGHQDWTRMKCGSGLSIATAYGAVKALKGS